MTSAIASELVAMQRPTWAEDGRPLGPMHPLTTIKALEYVLLAIGDVSGKLFNEKTSVTLILLVELPPQQQLETVHKLIDYGVSLGKIKPDYTLFGHRQVREGTECPGDRLFEEISTWEHFSPNPPHVWSPNLIQTD